MRRLLFNRPKGIVQDGLVAEYKFDQRNRFKYSDDFSNAAWDTNNLTKTIDSVMAPDGRTTADTVTETAVNSQHRMNQFPASGADETHALSVYAKYGTRPWIMLYMANSGGTNLVRAWFDIMNGLVGTVTNVGNGSGAKASIQDVGNGWYRCTLVGKPDTAAGSMLVSIYVANLDGSSSHLGDVSKYVYLWGAQLELGSASTAYKKTTDNQTLWNGQLSNLSVTNILTGGSFETDGNADGVADGWTKSGGTPSLDTTALYGLKAQRLSGNNDMVYKDVTALLTGGHVYYARASGYVNSGAGRFKIGTVVGANELLWAEFTTVGRWSSKSGVFTYSSGNVLFQLGPYTSSDAQFDGALLIDLTTLFGAGSEPTAAQCDELFPDWFDGSVTLNVSKYNGMLGSTSGSDVNDPTWNGQGASFDGGDFIDLGPMEQVKSAIVAFSVTGLATTQELIGKLNSGWAVCPDGDYCLAMNTTGKPSVSVKIAGADYSLGSDEVLSPNNVYIVGFCHDGIDLKIWARKTEKPEAHAGTFSNATTKTFLGERQLSGSELRMTGSMYYALFYNRALSFAEFIQNMNVIVGYLKQRGISVNLLTTSGTYRTNLAAEYRFEEGSGQSTVDGSGNSKHGTLGSTTGSDINDPTWATEGLSFGADDYVDAGNVNIDMKHLTLIFYNGSVINKSSAASPLGLGVGKGLYFGGLTGDLTDEILTLAMATGKYVAKCTAAGSISVGWHHLDVYWDGTKYYMEIDGVDVSETRVGTPALITISDLEFGRGFGSYFDNGKIAYAAIYSETLTPDQRTQNRNALRVYMAQKGVVLA